MTHSSLIQKAATTIWLVEWTTRQYGSVHLVGWFVGILFTLDEPWVHAEGYYTRHPVAMKINSKMC